MRLVRIRDIIGIINMQTNDKYVIIARELTKRFGALTAVNRISFSVKKGEIFGFLGPNGAGKTTTIRMLTGLLVPNSGDVLINGIHIKTHPIRAKKNMGVIPEMGNIYVDLTARQNIVLAGKFYGIPKRELERRTASILKQLGLEDRMNDPVKTFSRGMKQRVNIASALVHDPQILFLDEPTSGLDVQSQRLIKHFIQEMKRQGTTVFLTTHNIEDANQLCERIAIIHQGELVTIDRPERLRKTFDTTQSVEVSFDSIIDISKIKKIDPINRIEKRGDKWKLYTENPDKLVKNVVRVAQEKDFTILSMEICRASLEDAFVKLTDSKRHA